MANFFMQLVISGLLVEKVGKALPRVRLGGLLNEG